MNRSCPRLVVAALRGGAGKTTLSVAMAVALQKRGISVVPFKKGPDYIDAAWLSRAAAKPCCNLDTFLMSREQVVRSFSRHATEGTVSLIEGNRGLFDGVNSDGEFSTAELAKLLNAPVILVVDCDKVTRTAAAMVLGCRNLDPTVDIRGVILSRVNGSRHAAVIRQSIEESCHLPVYGTVPRMKDLPFTERHLGLIPPQEHDRIQRALDRAGVIAEDYLDIPGLLQVAESASPWGIDAFPHQATSGKTGEKPVRIGVIKDAAFQFYYSENIEALVDCGARIVEISALDDKILPDVDALYIGGGFPETQAGQLARNETFRRSLRAEAEAGLPIYAECGGFIYLGESLTIGDEHYPMVGALPVTFSMEKRPQGHGYVTLAVDRENHFFPVGTKISGHEFHYCRVISLKEDECHTTYRVLKGTGIDGQRDGLCRKNILAGFTHVHALGTPQWAVTMVEKARQYRAARQNYQASYSHLSC
ncbi:MAG: cobyrinic acid a,c-diamide synthase [Deltaproteobacteria bacterium HGW-Deltaproteobacteria-9]|nr:MAG: cobyrinic acid a,c-diamide synthase [Deltaproteobacteria bacterium HGW-Deltaproteobacteria-9]